MKLNQYIGILVVSVFSLSTIIGCSNAEQENTEKITVAPENLLVVDYAVEGMVCAMGCAKTIQDEVADMSGVVKCSVDFETGKAHIEFDKTQVTEEAIITKIESIADGQYKVSKWEEKEIIEEEAPAVEEEGNSENGEPMIEVAIPSIQIPNLFTFLIERI